MLDNVDSWIDQKKMKMYHKVSNNHDHHVENDAHGHPSHLHAVPHGVYPLSTKHSEHNEEWMEEVTHVPPGQHAVAGDSTHTIPVAFSKQLHAHHSEDEHDDGQHQGQVAQSTDWITNNFDQGVKSGPRFCQLEDSQLLKTKQKNQKQKQKGKTSQTSLFFTQAASDVLHSYQSEWSEDRHANHICQKQFH